MSKAQVRFSNVPTELVQIVREQPGIHFRGLERAAGLSSTGQLRHHVDRLTRGGVLVEVPDGGYTRFFLAGEHDRRMRPRLARYARPVPSRIARLLLEGRMTRTQLRRRLGCADSTLGYYLARMEGQGELVRCPTKSCCWYELADADAVREVLRMQGPPSPERPDAGPIRNDASKAHAMPHLRTPARAP